MTKLLKSILAATLAFSLVACSNTASNEPTPAEEEKEEEVVEEETAAEEEAAEEETAAEEEVDTTPTKGEYVIYNSTGEDVTELYIFENGGSDNGENYVETVGWTDGVMTVSKEDVPANEAHGRYTLKFVTAGGYEGVFETLSQEEAPIALISKDDSDAMTGGTQISFSVPVYFTVTYAAAHGNKCFSTAAVAVTKDGTIVDAYLDEYQYMAADGNTGVPNSDADADGAFATYFNEGQVLGSKKVNHEAYSAHMAEAAGATTDLRVSYEAIEDFVKGKNISELEGGVDEVTGSTLADTPGYVALIVDTAKAALEGKAYYGAVAPQALEIVEADYAAHGDKCFTFVANLMSGDKVIATYIDEFQYMAADTAGIVPVPNGDDLEGFGGNNKEGYVLISKKVNNDIYSANMADHAGATQEILVSYNAIEDFVANTKLEDLDGVDAVTGSTLVDTAGYVSAVVNAANSPK